MLAALLACLALFGQSVAPATPLQTFRVHGIVTYYKDTAAPGAQLTFESDKVAKSVSTDKNGSYEVELPVGLYTVIVNPGMRGFKEYRRPLFRVASPASLAIDATVEPGMSCDIVVPAGSGHVITEDEALDACGGLDSFAVPSEDGVPFQLFIDYPSRQRKDRENIYSVRKSPDSMGPVLVAYNLFTLQADRVVYGGQSRELVATGDVAVKNTDGTTQRADSMTFRIEDGEAIPLH